MVMDVHTTYTSLLGCCLSEACKELESKRNMAVCVQRTESLLQPDHCDLGQILSSSQYLLFAHQAEGSLL